MTLAFLRLSPDERKLYVDEAAACRGLSPIILEKDFWACWLLRHALRIVVPRSALVKESHEKT